MADNEPSDLSPLAQEIYKAHRARPKANMYATQSIIDHNDVEAMDAAYAELVNAGLVREGTGKVSVVGKPRSTFVLVA